MRPQSLEFSLLWAVFKFNFQMLDIFVLYARIAPDPYKTPFRPKTGTHPRKNIDMKKTTKVSQSKPGSLAPPENQDQAPLPARKPAAKAASAPAVPKPAVTAPKADPVQGKGTATATLILETGPAAANPAPTDHPRPKAVPADLSKPKTARKAPTTSKASKTPPITILRVIPIADIHVAYGTPPDSALPKTMEVITDNVGAIVSVGVAWINSGTTTGPVVIHSFTGTLVMPTGITNPNGLTASARVIVAEAAPPPPPPKRSLVKMYWKRAVAGVAVALAVALLCWLGRSAWNHMHASTPTAANTKPKAPDVPTDSITLQVCETPIAATDIIHPAPIGSRIQREWNPVGNQQWISISGNSNVFNAPVIVNGATNNPTDVSIEIVAPGSHTERHRTNAPAANNTPTNSAAAICPTVPTLPVAQAPLMAPPLPMPMPRYPPPLLPSMTYVNPPQIIFGPYGYDDCYGGFNMRIGIGERYSYGPVRSVVRGPIVGNRYGYGGGTHRR